MINNAPQGKYYGQECITQDDVINILERRIIHKVSVDKEEDGQIDFLAG